MEQIKYIYFFMIEQIGGHPFKTSVFFRGEGSKIDTEIQGRRSPKTFIQAVAVMSEQFLSEFELHENFRFFDPHTLQTRKPFPRLVPD